MPRSPSRVIVEATDVGDRADVILGRRLPGLSRRAARRLALDGKLRVDGERAAPSLRPSAGAVIEVFLDVGDAEEMPALEVLRETTEFVYVHKPSGMHTVAQTPGQPGCLCVAVAAEFPECADASPDPLEAGAVHRLDRDTSGVVAFARRRESWEAAREGFSQRTIDKRYLAVVSHSDGADWPPIAPTDALLGWLRECEPLIPLPGFASEDGPSYEIRAPLGRGERRDTVTVRLDGRNSCTRVHRLATSVGPDSRIPRTSLLQLSLVTGGRHQIRAHLAWIGLPIVGDTLYGDPDRSATTRLHLHAASLDLSSCIPTEAEVVCPPPAGFWPTRA